MSRGRAEKEREGQPNPETDKRLLHVRLFSALVTFRIFVVVTVPETYRSIF